MSAGLIAELFGVLAPTFLLSRFFLWMMKSWDGGFPRLLIAHSLTAFVASTLSAFGRADGGDLDWSGTTLCLAAQVFWFAFDLVRSKLRSSKSAV